MIPLRRTRFDYFLIWGHGLINQQEILKVIRAEKAFEILRIVDHVLKNIERFVRIIYSHDYAPFHHLRKKTRYLLKTPAQVRFIFVRNQDVQETYRGEGAFRHVECDRVKLMKEEIRNRFNPRQNGQRTEDHVIHASDNEAQVHHILKYLGVAKGVDLFRNIPNPHLSLPYYVPKFDRFSIKQINSSQLRARILRGSKYRPSSELVELDDTPQMACLRGNTDAYQEYLDKYMGGVLTCDYSVERILALAQNFSYLEKPYPTAYILTQRMETGQFVIRDGLHRGCILKTRKVDRFPIAVIE